LFKNETAISLAVAMQIIMRVFAVSGYSGTGKTTLVEHIISALIKQGYTVATAKNTRHDLHEEKGTDSWRHRQAGARATVILGPKRSLVFHEGRKTLKKLVADIEADYLIVEGMKESGIPKIWCVSSSTEDLSTLQQSVKAIMAGPAKEEIDGRGIPVFGSSEIEAIVELVKREAIELSELQV
jgi:molybdopterin-guanine dinucleotide biosynthesis protein B